MITLLAVVVIALILFLFYALIWSENFNRERGKHHEYCVVFDCIYLALTHCEPIFIFSCFKCAI